MENPQSAIPRPLLTDWFRRVRESQHIHYACGNYFSRLHLMLGIPTLVVSTLVGTAVFASLDRQDIGQFKIIVGLASILAAILSGLQTFLGFSERAEKHRVTAAGYAAVRRQLEFLDSFPPASPAEWKSSMAEVKKRMDELSKSSPEVPASVHGREVRKLKERGHSRIFALPPEGQNAGSEEGAR